MSQYFSPVSSAATECAKKYPSRTTPATPRRHPARSRAGTSGTRSPAPRQRGHQRAQHRLRPPEEHRLAAVPVEDPLGGTPPLVADPPADPGRTHPRPQPLAELVPGRVAEDRRDDRSRSGKRPAGRPPSRTARRPAPARSPRAARSPGSRAASANARPRSGRTARAPSRCRPTTSTGAPARPPRAQANRAGAADPVARGRPSTGRASAGGRPARAPVSAGQATTCGVAGRICWSQPGQRYGFVDADPVTRRTTQSSPAHSTGCSGPE